MSLPEARRTAAAEPTGTRITLEHPYGPPSSDEWERLHAQMVEHCAREVFVSFRVPRDGEE